MEAQLCVHFADFRFCVVSQGEEDAAQLLLAEAVEEVTLVFEKVLTALEEVSSALLFYAGVMAGCKVVKADSGAFGFIYHGSEFDFLVAEHAGVGRVSAQVFVAEVFEDCVFIDVGNVQRNVLYADFFTQGPDFAKVVFFRGAEA